MDAITGSALAVVLVAVVLYALYWIVRKAVAAGIQDARQSDDAVNAQEASRR